MHTKEQSLYLKKKKKDKIVFHHRAFCYFCFKVNSIAFISVNFSFPFAKNKLFYSF